MRDKLEQVIFDDPCDVDNYLVYADWLTEQSDPRGEFIRAQVSLENELLPTSLRDQLNQRVNELLEQHQETWLGPFAPFLSDIPNYLFEGDGE